MGTTTTLEILKVAALVMALSSVISYTLVATFRALSKPMRQEENAELIRRFVWSILGGIAVALMVGVPIHTMFGDATAKIISYIVVGLFIGWAIASPATDRLAKRFKRRRKDDE